MGARLCLRYRRRKDEKTHFGHQRPNPSTSLWARVGQPQFSALSPEGTSDVKPRRTLRGTLGWAFAGRTNASAPKRALYGKVLIVESMLGS